MSKFNHCFSASALQSLVSTLLKPGLSLSPSWCMSHLMASTWISPCSPQQTRESPPAALNSSRPPYTLKQGL